jgi:hypothetical protein
MIDFNELWEKTIQSQYGTSPHIKGIIEAFSKSIDPTMDIKTFYEKFFDPRTAEGIGLDIWGIIVGVPRELNVDYGYYLGFQGSQLHPYDNNPFYYKHGATDVVLLADNAYRELIFLKAFANISDATMPSIKHILNAFFPTAVYKCGHMKIRIILMDYNISPYSYALLKTYGLLNLGAGVGWETYTIKPSETFGFKGQKMETFNNGIFAPYKITQQSEL